MIPGIAPAIRKKKAAPDPGGGYSFTMTAGDYQGIIQGYGPGFEIGSIDAEPIPGHPLLGIFLWGSSFWATAFTGNCLELVAGKTVWVDGVNYPFDSYDWVYDADGPYGDATIGEWASAGPTFVNQGVYFIEIK